MVNKLEARIAKLEKLVTRKNESHAKSSSGEYTVVESRIDESTAEND